MSPQDGRELGLSWVRINLQDGRISAGVEAAIGIDGHVDPTGHRGIRGDGVEAGGRVDRHRRSVGVELVAHPASVPAGHTGGPPTRRPLALRETWVTSA